MVEMTLTERQHLIYYIFDFLVKLLAFWAKNKLKRWTSGSQNNVQATYKQVHSYFKKLVSTTSLNLKMLKMILLKGQNLTSLYFSRSFINLSSWKYSKESLYKAEGNAQPTSDQLYNHFRKVQNITFCDPENGQIDALGKPKFVLKYWFMC